MRRAAVAFALGGLGCGCVGLNPDLFGPDPLPPPARVPVLAAPPPPPPLPTGKPVVVPVVVPASYSVPGVPPDAVSLPRPTRWRELPVCRELVRRKGPAAVVLAETPPPNPQPARAVVEPTRPATKPNKPTAKDGELNWQAADEVQEPRAQPEKLPSADVKPLPDSVRPRLVPSKPEPPAEEPVEWGKAK